MTRFEDRVHAVAANARATQQWRKGRLSTAQRDEIIRKADAELGKLKE